MIIKTFSTPILIAASTAIVLTACNGGAPTAPNQPVAQTPPPAPPPPPPPVSGDVTVSGSLSFERVPLSLSTNGLDYNNSIIQPIRAASVELLDGNGGVIERTSADDEGFYSFTVAANTVARVNVRAEISQSNVNFQVIDNTSNNALYTLQGSLESVGTTAQTRDLLAGSGWTGSAYTQTRAAAPFALLDTLLRSTEDFILADPDVNFPAFDVLWSVNNRSESGNVADGEIGSSSFTVSNGRPQIRILGEANTDTDEYDEHIVTHEFGHYIENQISRSDSIGGPHSLGNRLDPRVAFSEGWGNALSAILTGDTIYRDSGGPSQAGGFQFDVENNTFNNQGWYSEASAQSILYDIFDSRSDGADQISLGLGPLYETFISSDYIEADAAATLYSYLDNFITVNPGVDQTALTTLVEDQRVFGQGAEGLGETNDGGLATNLPVYRAVVVDGAPLTVCSVNDNGIFNRLGNRVFLTLDLDNAASLDFAMQRVSGPTARDPDFRIFRQGGLVARGISPDADLETASINLAAGRYVISTVDDRNARLNDDDETGADSCFSFTVAGG